MSKNSHENNEYSPIVKGDLLTGGVWTIGEGESFESRSPWNNRLLWSGNSASVTQIDAAVDSAKNASQLWRNKEFEERLGYLSAFIEALGQNSEELSNIVALEAGKLLWEAKQEVSALIGKLDATVDAYIKRAKAFEINADIQGVPSTIKTRFIPHGVAVVLSPFNFPVHMMNGHIIPALLAGNAVVLKPSEFGVASAIFYSRVFSETNLPRGVFSCLAGKGDVGKLLVRHSNADAVFFTGSDIVANEIRLHCAKSNKRCALEAGGNSSIFVESFDDLDTTLQTIVESAYWSAGQRCNSTRNLIITRKLFDADFLGNLSERIKQISLNLDYHSESNLYGVMRREADVDRLMNVQDALERAGAEILIRSASCDGNSLLVSPALIKMPSNSELFQEELMGPMLKVHVVDNLDSAVSLMNKIGLRLTAGIVSVDRSTYEEFCSQANYGGITWNCHTANASGYASFGGFGRSGNCSPAGYLSIDYCVTAQSIMEKPPMKDLKQKSIS